jgi:hypothetical protein
MRNMTKRAAPAILTEWLPLADREGATERGRQCEGDASINPILGRRATAPVP